MAIVKWMTIFFLSAYCLIPSLTFAELRDPTRPPGNDSNNPVEAYVLSSILISKDRKIAVINNKWLAIGDVIDNAKVIAINANTVEIESSQGKQTLILLTNAKKNKESP